MFNLFENKDIGFGHYSVSQKPNGELALYEDLLKHEALKAC